MLRLDLIKDNNQWKSVLKKDFDWTVIGGEIISQPEFYPNRKPFSLAEIYHNARSINYDMLTAVNAVENEIKERWF